MKKSLNYPVFIASIILILLVACTAKDQNISSTPAGAGGTGPLPSKATMIVKSSTSTVASTAQAIITATCTDSTGTLVLGQQVMFSLSDPTMGTISNGGIATTNNAGTAIVTFIPAQGKTGKVTITAAYEAMSAATDVTIVDTSSTMAISISASPVSVTTGAATIITVHVVDGTGNIAPDGTNVTFSLDNGLKGTLQSSAQATSGGDAKVSFKAGTISTVAVITATVGNATANVAISITGGTAAVMLVTASTIAITAGQTSVISATVVDVLNKPVSGAKVAFTLSDVTKGALSVSSSTTDANGVAKTTLTGTGSPFVTVNADCLGYSSSVSVNISGIASSGSMALSATLTSVVVGGNSAITALLRDGQNQPMQGVTVNFALSNAAAGSISSPTALTNSNGVASVTYTAGLLPTSGVVTASYATLGLSSTVNLTVTAPAPADVTSTATPTSITGRGTSTIKAIVTDSNGNPVLDGTQVNFTLSDSSFGVLSNTFATTSGGTGAATVTFTASNKGGAVTLTAVAGNISKTTTITITPAPTGSIQFISASPQVIGIKGSGQIETSSVTFLVTDITGSAVTDGTSVSFSMRGPGGGAYIGSTPGSLTATGSTVNGAASVVLNSGSVAGPVTLIASTQKAGGLTIYSSATQISIGGGVPSAGHWNLATSKFNLSGLSISGLTAQISAYIADRFGNYNILSGTALNYYPEAGAIISSTVTDATGLSMATLRTQWPNPANEKNAMTIDADFTDFTPWVGFSNEPFVYSNGNVRNPRDGWVTVLATTMGEEQFIDENGDGMFTRSYSTTACPIGYSCECDGGTANGYAGYIASGLCTAGLDYSGNAVSWGGSRSEGFKDLGEPFIDANDNGKRDDGSVSGYAYEQYIDANGNGSYDGPNGLWDGPGCMTSTPSCISSKTIWKEMRLVFTDNVYGSWPEPDANNCYNLKTDSTPVQTLLSAGTTSVDAIISVGSTTSFPTSGTILIGSELINYAGTTATTFTGCTRGVLATVRVAHLAAAAVDFRCTASYGAGTSFAIAPAAVEKGGTGVYCVNVADANLNSPPGGTVIAATASPGKIAEPSSITMLDALSTGPSGFCFTVSIDAAEKALTAVVGATVAGLPVATAATPLVPPMLKVASVILPDGQFTGGAQAYSVTLAASGGTPPYVAWSITAGALPAGLSLNSATGVISGTPTGPGTTISSFTVRVADSLGNTAPATLSITIN